MFSASASSASKTDAPSLFIGAGVRVEGKIIPPKNGVVVIEGVLSGDIISDGLVVVTKNGVLEAGNELRCFEMQVDGKIEGKDVTLEAGVLKLSQGAKVTLGEVNLPPGGLEQARGSVLCARIAMAEENAFAKDERLKNALEQASAAEVAAPLSGLKVQGGPTAASSMAPQPASASASIRPTTPAAAPATTASPVASTSARVLPLGGSAASATSSFRDDDADAAGLSVYPKTA